MRAVVINDPGGLSTLREVALAEANPGPGEVQLSVRAAGINRGDLRLGPNTGQVLAQHIPGSECAGVITQVGPGGDSTRIGARVMALLPGRGGYAEKVIVPMRALMPIPPGMNFEQAATIPVSFLTAEEALFGKAELLPNETVLVHADNGGAGSAALQLALAEGARVVATAGSSAEAEWASQLGAAAFSRQDHDWATRLLRSLAERSVDLVLDSVGAALWPVHEQLLANGGRLVSVISVRPARISLDLELLAFRCYQLIGVQVTQQSNLEQVALTQRFLRTRYAGFLNGRLAPSETQVFDLSDAAEAHRQLSAGDTLGRLVLRISASN